jgi:hypothetical protein
MVFLAVGILRGRIQWLLDAFTSLMMALRRMDLVPKFKITVSFMQIFMAVSDVYMVEVPSNLATWMAHFEWMRFNIFEIYPATCFGKYENNLHAVALFPLAVIAVTALVVFAWKLFSKHTSDGEADSSSAGEAALYPTLLLLFCFAPGVARSTFMSWSCDTIRYSSNETHLYLFADHSVRCSDHNDGGFVSSEHDGITTVSWIYVILWPLGVEVLFIALLYLARHEITTGRHGVLEGATSVLHREYKRTVFWWEAMELFRRTLLTGLLLLIPNTHTVLRLLTATFICIIFSNVLCIAQPYRRDENNILGVMASTVLACTFLASLMIKLFDDFATVDASGARSVLGYSSTDEIGATMIGFSALYLLLLVGSLVRLAVARTQQMRRRKEEQTKSQIRKAVTALQQIRQPATFIPFDKFLKLGRLIAHEQARNLGLLKSVDTYEEVGRRAMLVSSCPVPTAKGTLTAHAPRRARPPCAAVRLCRGGTDRFRIARMAVRERARPGPRALSGDGRFVPRALQDPRHQKGRAASVGGLHVAAAGPIKKTSWLPRHCFAHDALCSDGRRFARPSAASRKMRSSSISPWSRWPCSPLLRAILW